MRNTYCYPALTDSKAARSGGLRFASLVALLEFSLSVRRMGMARCLVGGSVMDLVAVFADE